VIPHILLNNVSDRYIVYKIQLHQRIYICFQDNNNNDIIYSLRKSPLDSAHVLFVHLSVADLCLHDAGVPGSPAEHEQTAGQPVQTVNGPKIPQVVLFGQHEHHSVVPITTARMNLTRDNNLVINIIFY